MEQIIEKWEEILRTVKEEHELTDISFKTWLEPLKVFDVKDNTLYILVPDEQMGLNYITKKYTLPIKVAVAEIIGKDYEIEFVLPEQAKSMRTPKPMAFVNTESIDKSSLNPNYTFDTFVVGNNNKLAHAASLAVAESPGEVYNPLFLYGGVGLGKTHLMHSIAHFIQSNNPDVKILYVSSETFTNELIETIRNGNNSAMSKFREKYRNIAKAMGVEGVDEMSQEEYRQAAIDAVIQLSKDCEIAQSLKEIGVKEEDLPTLTDSAMADVCTGGNPRPCTKELIFDLYKYAFNGRD